MIIIDGIIYDTNKISKVSEEFENMVEEIRTEDHDRILWVGEKHMEPKNYKLFNLKKLVMENPIDNQPVDEIKEIINVLVKTYGLHENTYNLLVDILQLSLKAKNSFDIVKKEGNVLDINLAFKYKNKIKDEASDLYHSIQDKQVALLKKKLNSYIK